ncbi:MAG: SurA N-terminal domain-containing protein [Deltaproteobacteria bacterium]|nr:SurA N-terminal domain-containing protein [Deltaproteobacteria bacterium]
MLSLMRKHAQSWGIKFCLFAIAVVFVFWGVGSFSDKQSEKIATVNGSPITKIEYDQEYDRVKKMYRDKFGKDFSPEMEKMLRLKEQALDSLISQRLLMQAAEKYHLQVTTDDVRSYIANLPELQVDGRFDERRYFGLLQANKMKPAEFENTERQYLENQKISNVVMASAKVSEGEVYDRFVTQEEKVNLSFVAFSGHDYVNDVTFTPVALNEFFEKNKEKFRVPEKAKIRILAFKISDLEKNVNPSPQEIKDYYNDRQDKYTEPKKVRVRQIIKPLAKNSSKEEIEKVRQDILAVMKRAQSGEDFAELAKQQNEGPLAIKGGDMGYIKRGQTAPAFDKVIFSLKAGEMSEPIQTPAGWHLIKIEDIQKEAVKPFDKVKDEIIKEIKTREAMTKADDVADAAAEAVYKAGNLSAYAKANKLTLIETGYFAKNDKLAEVGNEDEVVKSAFALTKGEVSAVLNLKSGNYVVELVDLKKSYLPKLDEAKAEAEKALREKLGTELAKEKAAKLLEAMRAKDSLDVYAREQKKTIEETGPFARGKAVPKIGEVPDLVNAAFTLSAKNPYPKTAFEKGDTFFVVRFKEHTLPNAKTFAQEKDKLFKEIYQEKRPDMFTKWLEYLKKKSDIKTMSKMEG